MSTMLSLTHVKYGMHIITNMETLTTVYSCYGFALSNPFCCVSLSNVIPYRCPGEVKVIQLHSKCMSIPHIRRTHASRMWTRRTHLGD